MRIKAGEVLGQYRLDSMIGRGSMSDVYRAIHLRLGRPVAIKIIHPHLLDRPGALKRFSREANVLSAMRHPNIVRVYEYVVLEDTAYIVMEYLDGGTLETWLELTRSRGKKVSLKKVLLWMDSICNAVDFAHSQGLIHRDLKPANILFNNTGEPVLSDFGLAFLTDHPRLSPSNAITGTPAYLSPEQAQGESGDTRSDVYSLGVILYEILVGETPFSGNAVSVIMKHVSELPPSPRILGRYLPSEVEAVMLRALAKTPVERYQSAGALTRALRAAIERSDVPDTMQRASMIETDEEPVSVDNPALIDGLVEGSLAEAVSLGTLSNLESSQIPAQRGSVWRMALSGVVLLLGFTALGLWASIQAGNSEVTVTKPAMYSYGSMVRIVVPNGASTSVYANCPGVLVRGVLGITSDGHTGMVTGKMWCGEEWWYEIEIADLVDEEWGGVGWVESMYLSIQ